MNSLCNITMLNGFEFILRTQKQMKGHAHRFGCKMEESQAYGDETEYLHLVTCQGNCKRVFVPHGLGCMWPAQVCDVCYKAYTDSMDGSARVCVAALCAECYSQSIVDEAPAAVRVSRRHRNI